jgi:hypothetical protein
MNILIEIIGWIGTLSIVLAYFLLSNNTLQSSSRRYQLLNLFGAICVGINAFYNRAYPSLGLEIVWGLIAASTLVKSKLPRN